MMSNFLALGGEETHKNIQYKLNENEILATYSLAKEMKIALLSSSNRNRELLDYLELVTVSINGDKLLKFVNESVRDIEKLKKSNPNVKWSLQANKILSRLKDKDLEKDEVLEYNIENKDLVLEEPETKSDDKIIKFPKEYSEEERA